MALETLKGIDKIGNFDVVEIDNAARMELLAAIEHARWARWQEYLHSLCLNNVEGGSLIIPADKVERWKRQIATNYTNLSEREKESDREQVREYLPVFSPKANIHIDHDHNEITFRIQRGPVKENGVNGCQVDEIIAAAKIMIEGLNKNFPCRENSLAVTKLDEALMWLRERTRNREARGVEGFNKV